MDIDSLQTDAELARLLRLIRGVKASEGTPLAERCEALERVVTEVGRALKSARAAIEDGLGRDERVRDSVNACVVVASFIAGVQTQIISFTHQSNNSRLQITANLFAFVGMTLDVIGASSGVVCVILLRRSIERSRLLLMHFNEIRRRIYENTERICTTPDLQDIDRIMEEMRSLWRLCKKAQELAAPDAIEVLLQLLKTLHSVHPFFPLPIAFFAINKGLPGFSLVPLLTIAIGTLCLLVSVLAFAAASQLLGVWVSCLAITGAALLLLLILRVLHIPWSQRGAEYKELEKGLREALRRN